MAISDSTFESDTNRRLTEKQHSLRLIIIILFFCLQFIDATLQNMAEWRNQIN